MELSSEYNKKIKIGNTTVVVRFKEFRNGDLIHGSFSDEYGLMKFKKQISIDGIVYDLIKYVQASRTKRTHIKYEFNGMFFPDNFTSICKHILTSTKP